MPLTGSLQELTARFAAGTLTDIELRALRRDPRAGAKKLHAQHAARQKAQAKESARLLAMLQHEQLHWDRGLTHIAGVDEVGAGPLAGPVVAAAVILPKGFSLPRVDDSKKLTAEVRASLAQEIRAVAVAWALGSCTPAEIDRLNILRASIEAMRRAVCALATTPEHVLVDARRIPRIGMPQTAITKGDTLSQSIAAASILAKVYRDELMHTLDFEHPGYGFASHVGYGTAAHLKALSTLGPCAQHRRSFAPVAQAAGIEAARQPCLEFASGLADGA